MTKARIAEIFYSLQGEGLYIGTGCIFVRFSGCNIKCRFCDTKTKDSSEYTPRGLIKTVNKLIDKQKPEFLSLTGGEPLIQSDFIYDFLKEAKFKKRFVYLETNGILHQNFVRLKHFIDVVAMDIKLPSATGAGSFWAQHEEFIKACAGKELMVKAVITLSTRSSDINKAITLIKKLDKNIGFVLQPNYRELGPKLIARCIDFNSLARQHLPNVRVIPQVHKMLGIR